MNTPELPLLRCAVAYLRTSSATNVGEDKDSDKRQRAAIDQQAGPSGFRIVKEFYDAKVKGADSIDIRPGFTEMLAWCAENDCRTIFVESAHRFARDLIVQETGYQLLKKDGYTLIAADDADAFTSDTPTQTLIRQILGAVSEYEKAALVSKMKAARDRKSAALGLKSNGKQRRIEGPKLDPEQIAAAKKLHAEGLSLRKVAAQMAEAGFVTSVGTVLSAAHIKRLVED